ncbi:hypothetical protein [Streptomyces sp. NPDC096030]|uniref:hypothetical protein n=1 Tax=Streptomyces sp. NPDC096030 TaxID=3155423 RepID=UPI00332DA70D
MCRKSGTVCLIKSPSRQHRTTRIAGSHQIQRPGAPTITPPSRNTCERTNKAMGLHNLSLEVLAGQRRWMLACNLAADLEACGC